MYYVSPTLVLLGILLFLASDFLNPNHMALNILGPLNNRDLAFSVFIFAGWLADPGIARRLFNWRVLCFGVLLMGLTVVGFANGNALFRIANDLRVWTWALCGWTGFSVLQRTGRVILGLVFIAGMFALALTWCVWTNSSALNLETEGARVAGFGISSNALVVSMLSGIIVLRGVSASKWSLFAAFLLIGVTLYATGVVGSNRSGVLSVSALLAALCASLFKLASLLKEIPPARRRALAAAWGIVLGFVLVAGSLVVFTAGSDLTVVKRFGGEGGARASNDGRIEEASFVIGDLSAAEWAIGRGFGGTFRSIVPGYIPEDTHIGILTFALKGGAFPLAVAALTTLVILPAWFLRALLRCKQSNTGADYGILSVWPSLASWIVLLCVSGGYTLYAAFGVGVCMAAFSGSKRINTLRQSNPMHPRHLPGQALPS